MRYVSTRSQASAVHASEAIRLGLASDGGLFVPEKWPTVARPRADLSFSEFASQVLQSFFTEDPLAGELPEICRGAFDFPIPLRKISDNFSVLELFHGPTSAFKDFGARFLALCMEKIPDVRAQERLVMVATSGDTGGAVAAAFKTLTKIPVVILYPKGRISQRQEKQLTVWGPRVRAFAVEGTFDDCQRIVKETFLSSTWQRRYQLISANSINLARLLPQMAYFAFASLQLPNRTVIVPSGNVGNATAALWAQRLGFPIGKVILSHNANTTVPHFFRTGQWGPRKSVDTLANAMDVGNPSNFERIRNLYPDLSLLLQKADALSVSDEQIRETIQNGAQIGNLWCPHTATAVHARDLLPEQDCIVVATAHVAKFETVVEPLIGQVLKVPAALQSLLAAPSVSVTIPADLQALGQLIL